MEGKLDTIEHASPSSTQETEAAVQWIQGQPDLYAAKWGQSGRSHLKIIQLGTFTK